MLLWFCRLLWFLVLNALSRFASAGLHRGQSQPLGKNAPLIASATSSPFQEAFSVSSSFCCLASERSLPSQLSARRARPCALGSEDGSAFPVIHLPFSSSPASNTMALRKPRGLQNAALKLPSTRCLYTPRNGASLFGRSRIPISTVTACRGVSASQQGLFFGTKGSAYSAASRTCFCLPPSAWVSRSPPVYRSDASSVSRGTPRPLCAGLARDFLKCRWMDGGIHGQRLFSSDCIEDSTARWSVFASSEGAGEGVLPEETVGGALDLGRLCGSVVKVYSDYTDPNYALPWQMQRQGSSSGSGFIIEGRLIVTNAHCVAWQNRLLVRKHGSPTKYLAQVVAVGHECDLALLTVEAEDFWKDTHGLRFGQIPALQDGVAVLGYPRGGDNLCITSGVVSRVDVNTYAHSNTALLCVQIDAAINPGNSGGPALREGRVVGVAFQGWDSAQNVGYVVPSCVIEHFLQDLRRNGRYTGFPAAGVVYQPLENECMRSKLGVDSLTPESLPAGITAGGILVTCTDSIRSRKFLHRAKQVASNQAPQGKEFDALNAESSSSDSACGEALPQADPRPVVEAVKAELLQNQKFASDAGLSYEAALEAALESRVGLRPQDVVMAVDGHDVANDGTVHFRGMERVSVSHVIADKFFGETLDLLVLRDRKVQKVVVPLEEEHALIPKHQWGKRARYLIYGGLVFCPLTLEYLKDEFGAKFHERAPSTLLRPLAEIFASVEGEEPIVLSQILASDLTSGYNFRNCLLSTVDGIKVRNMRHLAQLLGVQTPEQQQRDTESEHAGAPASNAESPDEFVTFTLEEKVQVVLHKAKAAAMLPAILQQHAIPSQTSEKL